MFAKTSNQRHTDTTIAFYTSLMHDFLNSYHWPTTYFTLIKKKHLLYNFEIVCSYLNINPFAKETSYKIIASHCNQNFMGP